MSAERQTLLETAVEGFRARFMQDLKKRDRAAAVNATDAANASVINAVAAYTAATEPAYAAAGIEADTATSTFEIECDGERSPRTDLIAAVLTFGETCQQGRIDASLLLDGRRAARCWVEGEVPHLAEFHADGGYDEVAGLHAARRLRELIIGARFLRLVQKPDN